MDERIGFVGMVVEDRNAVPAVNRVLSEFGELIIGRIGVPDHESGIGVIGILVRGDMKTLGAMTGKLGNIAGVTVRSAVTKEKRSNGESDHE